MNKKISRREFLKLVGCGLGSLVAAPYLDFAALQDPAGLQVLRVAGSLARIRKTPDPQSEVIYTRSRDDLMNAYYEERTGTSRNPLWYRVWNGYAHSAMLQPVKVRLNLPLAHVPETGLLVEVSVPYTRSMLQEKDGQWLLNYRLYYGSTHWINGVVDGPDHEPWYRIQDHFDRVYYAAAAHLYPIPPQELAPIAPSIEGGDKYIKVSIDEQSLTAYENGKVVLQTHVSTGLPQEGDVAPGQYPSDTPLGDHHITVKTPSRHMGDKKFTSEIDTLALPGVPWVCFFKEEGYGLHGTYWHNNFGYKMSHGCVNMPNDAARWIYRWAQPVVPQGEKWFSKWGTRVSIS